MVAHRIAPGEEDARPVIIRLSVMTALMGLFALGFASLVRMDRPMGEPIMASGNCLDSGLVCAPRAVRTGL